MLVYREGGFIHARVAGAIDGDSVPGLSRRLAEALNGGCERLTLDLGAAEYVNSDGVRWLQRVKSELGPRGIPFRLAVRQGSGVERTLDLLRLGVTFDIERYPSDTEAAVARV
jgi:anti-anti-sigma factor